MIKFIKFILILIYDYKVINFNENVIFAAFIFCKSIKNKKDLIKFLLVLIKHYFIILKQIKTKIIKVKIAEIKVLNIPFILMKFIIISTNMNYIL